jgi:sulfite reductase (ferredoxin)
MLGGGLGSQPSHAVLLSEFIPVNQIIPTTEGVLRIFDRFGERAKRLKAREILNKGYWRRGIFKIGG